MQFDFKATVQADGKLADIQPDATLPEAIQSMIRKRAVTWRYKPKQWQGKPYSSPIAQTIKAVAVPTTQGGFALRIEEVAGQMRFVAKREEGVLMPPPYPHELRRRGVSAILVYSVLYDEVGKPQQVDLVYPSALDRDIKRFDEAARNAIAKWKATHEFAGVPIACRANVPITFQVENADGTYGSLRVPPEVVAYFDKYTDMCPSTKLETPVKDTFL